MAAVKRAQTGEPPGPTGDLEALSTRLLTAAGVVSGAAGPG